MSVEFQELLGTEWVQFDITVTIPEVHIVLRRADEKKLVELLIDSMSSVTHIGLDFLDSAFTLHVFNIRDHTFAYLNPAILTHAPYPYLIETYIPMTVKFTNLM